MQLNTINKQIIMWAGILLGVYLIHRLTSVFIPFLISIGLAYLANPLVLKIESKKIFNWSISRTWAVSLVYTIIIIVTGIILFIAIPVLINQIATLIHDIPEYISWFQNKVMPHISKVFDIDTFVIEKDSIKGMLGGSLDLITNISKRIAATIGNSTLTIFGFMASLILIPMLTFYFMRDWLIIVQNFEKLLPRSIAPQILEFLADSNAMLSSFLRGQFTVMIMLAMVYSIGLSIIGLEYGVLIGVIAGLISFIPYLGASSGIAMGLIVAWFQFGDLTHLIFVGIVFGIGQLLESFVLTPILIGDKLGMHPLAVVFGLMVGGSLFGFFGILLALPACAVLMVALRKFYKNYTTSHFYLNIK